MQPAAPSRKTDGFDMAKLQKSVKQRQQRGSQARKPQVARLTPAEIRSLSQSASAAAESSNSKVSPSVSAPRRKSSGTGTVPITPDHDKQTPLPRSSTVPLPTPPRSPVKHGHCQSQTAHRDSRHGRRDRSSTANDAVNPRFNASRNSSVSSYRSANSLQMYRGHEVTQTGHKVMLQRPKQEIVSNPLSMFSRPRQSQLQASTSPDKFKRDFLELDPYQAQAMLDTRPEAPSVSNRAPSPPRLTDSPVSADEAHESEQAITTPPEVEKSPSSDKEVKPSTKTGQSRSGSDETVKPPKAVVPEPEAVPIDVPPTITAPDASKETLTSQPKQSPDVAMSAGASQDTAQPSLKNATEMEPPVESDTTRKDARKRFTFHHVFDKKDKGEHSHSTKKDRRNTLTFTKSPQSSPQPSQEPVNPPAKEASTVEKDQQDPDSDIIPSHPAVRPPSIRSRASSIDSKQRPSGLPQLNTSVPMYGRCACCGKIRRPNGHGTELSPVMENENLRTNFSLEADRTSYEARRYTPIIPIEVPDKDDAGSIRTVQASIEPRQPQSAATSIRNLRTNAEKRYSNSSSISVATTQTTLPTSVSDAESPPRTSKRSTLDEPRITRFSSLHGARGGDTVIESAGSEAKEEIVQSVPFIQLHHQSLVPQPQPQQRVLLPSQQQLAQQQLQQYRHSAMPVMSGGVQRAPHPLRQSSPMDQMVEDLHEQRPASLNGSHASIKEAQEQEIKRVPKQDIITVIPLKKQPGSPDTSPQATSPADGHPASNGTADSTLQQLQQPSEPTPNKLKKNSPGLSAQSDKTRRLSLPAPHKFRLPGTAKRAETIPLPYSSVQPGTPPETDPALRPPLPSQTPSARTSMSSAAEARDYRASMSASRRTSRSQDRSTGLAGGVGEMSQIQGTATGTFSDSGGKKVRPSPSFARFVANLPATHANKVPEAKKFGWRRKGIEQQQQPPQVGTIAESEGESTPPAGSIGGRTPQGGRSRATSVNGVSGTAAEALPTAGMETGGPSRPLTLPLLQLGGGLGSSGTIHRLAHGEGALQPKTGGFVGGVKLEQMLERQRSTAVEGRG